MSSRHGVTLMEVLVAIFIMGIGMLAMLVLFPLGVLTMAQAIQFDRMALAARTATAVANIQGVRNDPAVLYDPNTPAIVVAITNGGAGYVAAPTVTFASAVGAGASGKANISNIGQVTSVSITSNGKGYVYGVPITVSLVGGGGSGATATVTLADAFTNPGGAWAFPPADPHGPSYPVFVDPMGYFAVQGQTNQNWLAGLVANSSTIPRRTTSFALSGGVPNGGQALRWTCLLDDIPFAIDGTPQYDVQPIAPAQLGAFTRDIRYCWAYMLKRPRTSDPSVVNMDVVVFNNNRPILSSAFNEYLYQTQGGLSEVTFIPSATSPSITIDVSLSGNAVPPARPGDWLLDASYVPNQSQTHGTVNGNFYRIVGVTQNSDTSYTFEVLQPLRNMPATMAINPATNAPYAWQKILFLEGVAEVFEKGPGRIP